MKTCLVIGAQGFIGSAIAAAAAARGYELSAVDLDNYAEFRGAAADLLKLKLEPMTYGRNR